MVRFETRTCNHFSLTNVTRIQHNMGSIILPLVLVVFCVVLFLCRDRLVRRVRTEDDIENSAGAIPLQSTPSSSEDKQSQKQPAGSHAVLIESTESPLSSLTAHSIIPASVPTFSARAESIPSPPEHSLQLRNQHSAVQLSMPGAQSGEQNDPHQGLVGAASTLASTITKSTPMPPHPVKLSLFPSCCHGGRCRGC